MNADKIMVSFAHGLGWSGCAFSIACGRFRRGDGSLRPGRANGCFAATGDRNCRNCYDYRAHRGNITHFIITQTVIVRC